MVFGDDADVAVDAQVAADDRELLWHLCCCCCYCDFRYYNQMRVDVAAAAAGDDVD